MLQLFKLFTLLEEMLEPKQTLLCAIPSSWLYRFMPLKGLAFLISAMAQGYKGKPLNLGHILAGHSPDGFEPVAVPGTNPRVKVSLLVQKIMCLLRSGICTTVWLRDNPNLIQSPGCHDDKCETVLGMS